MVRTPLLVAILLAIALWQWRRHARANSTDSRRAVQASGQNVRATPSAAAVPTVMASGVHAAMLEARWRFWRHTLDLPDAPRRAAQLTGSGRELRRALLEDPLDPRYFPRRPMLMPELLAAVHDPNAAPRRLADIVARDPVLTGDVLKLANSAFYRRGNEPVETIQRAIVVCGTDGLQSLAAAALVQPVFRAGSGPLSGFPAALWDCTARCALGAEMRAQQLAPAERFSAQLLMLLAALGPLVVFRAMQVTGRLDGELQAERLAELIGACGVGVAQRVAADWHNSPRLVAALGGSDAEQELGVLGDYGLLVGTLAELSLRRALPEQERAALFATAGLEQDAQHAEIWGRLTRA